MSQIVIPSGNKSQGGSGFGVSYYLPFLGCARRSYLENHQAQHKLEGGELALGQIPAALRPKDQYGKPKLDQRKVGTLFHKLLEYYHTDKMHECELLYEDGPEDLEWMEVIRLFKEYRKTHAEDHFGSVLSVEEAFKVGCVECQNSGSHTIQYKGEEFPKTPCPEVVQARDLMGVPIFTGRLDMKTMIASEKQAEYWAGRGLVATVGDTVLVDVKTKTRHDGFLVSWLMDNAQFNGYMMAYEALHPDEKVVGMIANVVVSTKTPTFIEVVVPPPTQTQRRVVRQMLAEADRNRRVLGEKHANPTHCFDYFKECPFLNKSCDRTNGGP